MFALQSSFNNVNRPLREETMDGCQKVPHPFAATVFFVHDAIKKMRACETDKNESRTYWRGMKKKTISAEFQKHKGGTELACASTSSDLAQAKKFAQSTSPLFFKIEADNFMSCGADISFVSVFPSEAEVLYPPLTYLALMGVYEDKIGDAIAKVVVVKPSFS